MLAANYAARIATGEIIVENEEALLRDTSREDPREEAIDRAILDDALHRTDGIVPVRLEGIAAVDIQRVAVLYNQGGWNVTTSAPEPAGAAYNVTMFVTRE